MPNDPSTAAVSLSKTQLGILSRIAPGANFTSYTDASAGQWSGADRRALAEAKLIEPSYRWPITNWSLVRRTPLGEAVAQAAV